MKIKGVIEDLKKKRMIVKIVKIYLGLFSGVVVGSVGSVHFWIVLGPAHISQDL